MTQEPKAPEMAKSSLRDRDAEAPREAPEPEGNKGSAVVFLNRKPQALAPSSPLGNVVSWSVSMIDECGLHIPDDVLAAAEANLDGLRTTLADLENERPASEEEIREGFQTFCDRHKLEMPGRLALIADIDALRDMPESIWLEAFMAVWKTWRFRRVPTSGDFYAAARDALRSRQERVDGIRRAIHQVEYRRGTKR